MRADFSLGTVEARGQHFRSSKKPKQQQQTNQTKNEENPRGKKKKLVKP